MKYFIYFDLKSLFMLLSFLGFLILFSWSTKTNCKSLEPMSMSNACSFLAPKEIAMVWLLVDIASSKIDSNNYKSKEENRKPKCRHCQKLGNMKENCFEIIGYPFNWQNKTMKRKPMINIVVMEQNRKEGTQFFLLNFGGLIQRLLWSS